MCLVFLRSMSLFSPGPLFSIIIKSAGSFKSAPEILSNPGRQRLHMFYFHLILLINVQPLVLPIAPSIKLILTYHISVKLQYHFHCFPTEISLP